jgi:flavodoxin
MKLCVSYISHTGNTKRFAEALSELLKAPIFDIATSESSAVAEFDLLIIGAPVIGGKPAPEVLAFMNRLPQGEGKKAILFCTYALAKGGTFKAMEKALAEKGYTTILGVGKRGVKPNKADFKAVLDEIAKAVGKQQNHTENQ